jgi:hypothetical protein
MDGIAATWFGAFGQIAVGVAVAYIAWRQHRTATDKLRLNLFEKRFAVYHALEDLIETVIYESADAESFVLEYCQRTSEAKFLFHEEVTSYLDEIKDKAMRLRSLKFMHSHLNERMENEFFDEMTAIIMWFRNPGHTKRRADLFDKYLNFKNI